LGREITNGRALCGQRAVEASGQRAIRNAGDKLRVQGDQQGAAAGVIPPTSTRYYMNAVAKANVIGGSAASSLPECQLASICVPVRGDFLAATCWLKKTCVEIASRFFTRVFRL
jgi:hypothetical protein